MGQLKGKEWKKLAKKFAKKRKAIGNNSGLVLAAMKEIYIPQIKKGTYKPPVQQPENGS
jgi:hypothetical protein